MSAEFTALSTQVTANTDVEASAVALLNGLAVKIADAAGDKTASLALSASLKSSADALSAAVVANTPAA